MSGNYLLMNDLSRIPKSLCGIGCLLSVGVLIMLASCLPQVARSQESATNASEQRPQDATVSNRLLPTGQIISPAGESLAVAGRPNDLCCLAQQELLVVKAHKQLHVVSTTDWSVIQSLDVPGGASLTGIAATRSGRVFVTNATNQVHVYEPTKANASVAGLVLRDSLPLPQNCFPCGLCLAPDESSIFVCLSKSNKIAKIDLSTRITTYTDVGIAPFEVEYVPGKQDLLLVTNIGGRHAKESDKTADSAGTETPVDERGVANSSLVSIVDAQTLNVLSGIESGLHPTALAVLPRSRGAGDAPSNRGFDSASGAHKMVVVTNTNDDSITLIDIASLTTSSKVVKPIAGLPYGSMPNSICITPDGKHAMVGLAGNNAIAVFRLSRVISGSSSSTLTIPDPIGFIPTAWYPSSIACDDNYIYVANLKGVGSRAVVRAEAKGRNSHDHLGTIQRIPISALESTSKLANWTETVIQSSKTLPTARLEFDRASALPRPVPQRLGEPSVFKHIIYVIKENRTYDQVFGDMPEGRGAAELCVFPERITPNHHALARRFGLLDNYYCNGVLSADGHSWATEANVTPYLERAFGGFARSYTFGNDPITYSSSGFIWDHVLAAGLSFRNYGEMDFAEPPDGMKYQEIWNAYRSGKRIDFGQDIGIEKLRRYSCRDYPGWGMMIPDVLRIDRFLEEFDEFKINNGLANLSIVYLPQDHLGGGVTSAAHMADNDLALGRLVDAVSHSKFWNDTLIIVNEDDPQNGYDHIDGHRSICLAISAYSKPGAHHEFFNQTSVVRTILHILGLPPMNQQDARAPLMKSCFTDDANLAPYDALNANVPLNERPSNAAAQSEAEREFRRLLATVPILRTGMKSEEDEENLNRFVWHEMKGWTTPYPSQWAGAHGRGLSQLGLKIHEDGDLD